MNVSLPTNSANLFTADNLGVPAPDCGGGTAYIDANTGEWDCTAPPPPAPQSSTGGLSLFLIAAAVAGYLYWHYGQQAQSTAQQLGVSV